MFVLRTMDRIPRMPDFILKLMDFVLKMMDFVQLFRAQWVLCERGAARAAGRRRKAGANCFVLLK